MISISKLEYRDIWKRFIPCETADNCTKITYMNTPIFNISCPLNGRWYWDLKITAYSYVPEDIFLWTIVYRLYTCRAKTVFYGFLGHTGIIDDFMASHDLYDDNRIQSCHIWIFRGLICFQAVFQNAMLQMDCHWFSPHKTVLTIMFVWRGVY